MMRLHVTAEGHTEQRFVQRVLAPHLTAFGIITDVRRVLTSTNLRAGRIYRGGLSHFHKVSQDILTWMRDDSSSDCRFTTMFDLYGLPTDFPGYQKAATQKDPYSRIHFLESAFSGSIDDRRFIPYIQLHEFEALVLSDPKQLDWEYMDHDAPIHRIVELVGDQNPELINDGPETAPSKRILHELPQYDKVAAGVYIVEKIGIDTLRLKCRHFNEWISNLERLVD